MKKMLWWIWIALLAACALQPLRAESNEEENHVGRGTGRTVSRIGQTYGTKTPEVSETDRLIQQRDADLQELRNTYDQKARTEAPRRADGSIDYDSPEYQQMKQEYIDRSRDMRESYAERRRRIINEGGPVDGVRNTGSEAKDARSDADWEADSPEAAEAKKKQWESRGDTLDDKGYRVDNKTSKETLWPPEQPGDTAKKVVDTDAHASGVGDNPRNTYGETLDHEKKFLDGKARGDMKDQAKTTRKAADATGRTGADPELHDQAETMKNYGDDVEAGVNELGEDPQRARENIDEWQKKADADIQKSKAEGKRRTEIQQKTREQIAESARRAENTGNSEWDEARRKANYGDTPTTSEAVEGRRQKVEQTNRAAEEFNDKLRQDVESGKVKAEGPDGKVKGEAPEMGKGGKALDAAGKAMDGVDIFSTAEDVKQDLKQGKIKEAAKKVGEAVVDEVTGGAYSSGKMVIERGGDYYEAKKTIDGANETYENLYDLEAQKKLREAGLSREEVRSLVRAKANGDESALNDKLDEMGIERPTQQVLDGPTGDEAWTDRAKQVGEGMVENAKKAGKFVKETAEDTYEITSTLVTEPEVIPELYENTKQNISDGVGSWWTSRKADQQESEGKQSLVDKLVSEGATPDGAQYAADALYNEGDLSKLRKLREMLQKKKHGGDSLRDMEGSNGEAGDEHAPADGPDLLDEFIANGETEHNGKADDAFVSMQNQRQMEEASNRGDERDRDLRNMLNKAGREAGDMQDEANREIAENDRENSIGNIVGNAVEEGFTEGGKQFGQALGNGAAQKVSNDIWGDDDDDHDDDHDDDKKGSKGSKGSKGGSKGSCNDGCGTVKGGSKGGSKGSKGSKGGTKSPPMQTARCAFCGYTAKYTAANKPSHCPQCGMGPGKAVAECSTCGHTWVCSASSRPGSCPRCGAGKKKPVDAKPKPAAQPVAAPQKTAPATPQVQY